MIWNQLLSPFQGGLMRTLLRRTASAALIAHIALALAACGPDDPSENNDNNGGSNNTTNNATSDNNDTTNNDTTNNDTTNNTTPDPCADVTCEAPEATCEGDEAVTYEAGTCVDGTCTAPVETRTDCAESGQQCMNGMCVEAEARPPEIGDLIITEVLIDSGAVGDDEGEWFEVYNTSDSALNMAGVTIATSGDEHVIPTDASVTITPQTYFVFGRFDDTAINGGAPVDYAYGDTVNLSNDVDTLTITNADGDVVTEVNYDEAAWPLFEGFALQWDGDEDLANWTADAPLSWCAAITPWDGSDGDAGTPGEANESCAVPADQSIYSIQNEEHPYFPGVDTIVDIDGVVVTALTTQSNGDPRFAWVQEERGGKFSGVYVDIGGLATADISGITVGETLVDLEGTFEEQTLAGGTGTITTVVATSLSTTGTAATPVTAAVIDAEVLNDEDDAEAWEGVLVRLEEPAVTDDAPEENAAFRVDAQAYVNTFLTDDDISAANCDVFEFVQGPLNFSSGVFKIELRSADDIGTKTEVPLAEETPSIDFDDTSVAPQYTCIYNMNDVTWNNTSGTDIDVTDRVPGTTTATTDPDLDETIPANDSLTSTLEAGTYHFTAGMGRDGAVIVLDEEQSNVMPSSISPGDLVITEIMYDASAVSDSDGEWIEIYNATNSDITINEYTIEDAAMNTLTVTDTEAVIIPASGYAVIAKDADPAINGGVTTVTYAGNLPALNNGGDVVNIRDQNNVVIDTVDYASFPDATGASLKLDSGALDATSNDDAANWCVSDQMWPMSAGDSGSPGVVNPSCPTP